MNFLFQNGLHYKMILVSHLLLNPLWSVAKKATQAPMNQCWYKYNPALLWSFVCFPFIPLMVSQKKKKKKKDITPSNILVWAMHKRSTLKNGVFSLVCISMLKKICGVTSMDEFKILSYREPKYKEKKKKKSNRHLCSVKEL